MLWHVRLLLWHVLWKSRMLRSTLKISSATDLTQFNVLHSLFWFTTSLKFQTWNVHVCCASHWTGIGAGGWEVCWTLSVFTAELMGAFPTIQWVKHLHTRNQGRQDWFAFIFIWQVLNCNVNNNTDHVQQATEDIQFPNKSVFVNIIRGNVFLNITKNTSTCHSNTSTWRWFSSAHCALSVEYYRPIRTILTRNTWQSQKKFSCQHK